MHRDDSTSSDVVASIEVDEANAWVEELHRDVDKPFSANQDLECLTMVHL